MQKVGAQYVVKRLADYVTAPTERPEERSQTPEPSTTHVEVDGLDGQIVRDDQGQPLGRARRLRGLAVYVIASPHADPVSELKRCLAEPESRVFFNTEDGHLTGLIYVPDPANAPKGIEGIRAEDI
ncbi:MAG TPA: hypothetical protein VFL82_13660 [Thermomicrobiales bacterium]|jgi:hypothetical protein|nr:hypothetical protein [Thermomicrobiales bacterium]